MKSINHGLYDWNLETNAIYFSPNFRILLGLAVVGPVDAERLARSLTSGRLVPLFDRRLIEHLKGETPRFAATCATAPRTEPGAGRASTASPSAGPTAARAV